jgi:hypothetical protein
MHLEAENESIPVLNVHDKAAMSRMSSLLCRDHASTSAA